MNLEQPGHDIIVIGGSAGAMPPLRALLARLPAELNASVFVVLHVPARGTGIFNTVASAVRHLQVRQARDGMTIERGHVYLAVPDCHLLLTEAGVLRLGRGPRENMSRPAIDALFRSAAVAYGNRVVGVLLSGMLNDGVAGLEAIKRCGGVAIVQDPDDATADEMPRQAMRTVAIDKAAPALQLGGLVARLVGERAGPPTKAPEDIRMEVAIAAGERADADVMRQMADPVAITCPSCGGVMSKLRDGKPLRFRCQVGHAMTADVLAQEQEGAVDEALRVALRVVEERAELVARMADDSRVSERAAAAELYDRRASEYRHYADVIRRAILLSMEASAGQSVRS